MQLHSFIYHYYLTITKQVSAQVGFVTPPPEFWHALNQHIEAETKWTPFADDIFKRIFLNENFWILIKIALQFVPEGSITSILALVQIMAWHRPGDKPLSQPMMVNLPKHICVIRAQRVNGSFCLSWLSKDVNAWLTDALMKNKLV